MNTCVYVMSSAQSHFPYELMADTVICFPVGMHYLHAEAPVKVIHRDLKSRNGKFLAVM